MLLSLAAVTTYLVAIALVYSYHAHFIFAPTTIIEFTPQNFGAAYEPVKIPSDHAELAAWYLSGSPTFAQPPQAKALLYLHGNYANIGANAEHAARLSRYGVNVLLPDYRGFGASPGPFPSERRVYEDAAAAWNWLVHQKGYAPSQIVIYGHSLGGAVAIHLANNHPDAAGLIVESSFTSTAEMARLDPKLRALPLSFLITNRFDSLDRVTHLRIPVLYIHGTADGVVPPAMAQRLYQRTPQPKSLVLIEGAGHANCATVGAERYKAALRTFLQSLK